MTTTSIQPVILCGGSGTRLWPLSRAGFPKQFLCLTGDESLFQLSTKRLTNLTATMPLIVCNEEHRFLVSEQLRESDLEAAAVLLEPVARNTAPALTLAALTAQADNDDPVMIVTPADQIITDAAAFNMAMHQAIDQADGDCLVVLGIKPHRAETGYGYIKVEAATPGIRVERFVEKPDADVASAYLQEGGYYWNAGMFIVKASVWLRALQCFRPRMFASALSAWHARHSDGKFVRPGREEFCALPSESIDYAVMEPATSVPMAEREIVIKMIAMDAGWNDLGAWGAVWEILQQDSMGNAHRGDVLTNDSRNTLVYADSRLVSLVGVDNLVVIETADAVLVADKTKGQGVKNIVASLGKKRRSEHALHRKVHRPWGWYDNVDEGQRFKVKRIQVKPGASLSLQKHQHRAEHWVVVTGTAEITCGDKNFLLAENQSTYIPLGEKHRLKNPGEVPLEIIEVQSGDYLGEDDIVRFEDQYGRDKW